MKKNQYFLNSALAVVLGIACVIAVLVRTFAPAALIPQLDIPNMAALSLATLLVDHYAAKGAKRCYICIPVFAALTFGILPFCAGFASILEAVKLAVLGGVVFTATTWIYTSLQDRLSTGPMAKLAPLFSALGLYLAVQCFAGLI
jgi:hypothetical protein